VVERRVCRDEPDHPEAIPIFSIYQALGVGRAQRAIEGIRLAQKNQQRSTLVAIDIRKGLEQLRAITNHAAQSELTGVVGELAHALEIVVDTQELAFRKRLDRLSYTLEPRLSGGGPLDLGDRIEPPSVEVGR
jgi:hypothetical protein